MSRGWRAACYADSPNPDTVGTLFGVSAIFVQVSMRSFDTLSEVEAWAKVNGGLDAVNEALAKGAFGTDAQSIRTALRYVEREELKIAERMDRDGRRERAMSAAEISAQAAQHSAREAYVSRWIAIVAALIAVLTALYTMMR